MTKYECDRCRASLEQYQLRLITIKPGYNCNGTDIPYIWDLCKECTEALRAYVRNEVDFHKISTGNPLDTLAP